MYYIELNHNGLFHSILSINNRTHFKDRRTVIKHAKEWNEYPYVRRYPLNECKAIIKEGFHVPECLYQQRQTRRR